MTNTQTSREFRVRYENAYGNIECFYSNDRRETNNMSLSTMGLVDEKINGKWVWLGKYEYVDFMRDMWAGKDIKDFEKKWVDSNTIPDFYTDDKMCVRAEYVKRH